MEDRIENVISVTDYKESIKKARVKEASKIIACEKLSINDKADKVAKIFGFDTLKNDDFLKAAFAVMISKGESENIAEIVEMLSTQSQEVLEEYCFILADAMCNQKEDIEIINSRINNEKKRINAFKLIYISSYVVVGIIVLSYILGNTKPGFLVCLDIFTLILSGINHHNAIKSMKFRRKKLDILLQVKNNFPRFINNN